MYIIYNFVWVFFFFFFFLFGLFIKCKLDRVPICLYTTYVYKYIISRVYIDRVKVYVSGCVKLSCWKGFKQILKHITALLHILHYKIVNKLSTLFTTLRQISSNCYTPRVHENIYRKCYTFQLNESIILNARSWCCWCQPVQIITIVN